MKIEISDDRWEAIKKVAQRYGLPAQVALDRFLDNALWETDPTELRLLARGERRAPAADDAYRELGVLHLLDLADDELDEPAATAVRTAEVSLCGLRLRLQMLALAEPILAEPINQDQGPYEDADYDSLNDADGRDGDIAYGLADGDDPAPAFFNYDCDYEPEFD